MPGRWNGTWVLPPLLRFGRPACICQHLSRMNMETRLGVEPSQTWSAATCLAVRPTRRRSEGRARTCATWLTARHGYRYITSDQSLKCLSTATGNRTRPSGMRPQRRLQLTLTAWRKAKESNPRALPRHPCFRDRLQSTLRRFPWRKVSGSNARGLSPGLRLATAPLTSRATFQTGGWEDSPRTRPLNEPPPAVSSPRVERGGRPSRSRRQVRC